jgi:hypothetical protein
MQTILLTDDQGYYPIGTFPNHTGAFVRNPMPVVVTDANGYVGGIFVGAPRSCRQVTNIPGAYTDGIAQVEAPLVAVQTDKNGKSNWSGAFVGAPTPVVLI